MPVADDNILIVKDVVNDFVLHEWLLSMIWVASKAAKNFACNCYHCSLEDGRGTRAWSQMETQVQGKVQYLLLDMMYSILITLKCSNCKRLPIIDISKIVWCSVQNKVKTVSKILSENYFSTQDIKTNE